MNLKSMGFWVMSFVVGVAAILAAGWLQGGWGGVGQIFAWLWSAIIYPVPVPAAMVAVIVIVLLAFAWRSVREGVLWPFLSESEKELLRWFATGDGLALPVELAAACMKVSKLKAKQVIERLSKRGLVDTNYMDINLSHLTSKGIDYVVAKGYAKDVQPPQSAPSSKPGVPPQATGG